MRFSWFRFLRFGKVWVVLVAEVWVRFRWLMSGVGEVEVVKV